MSDERKMILDRVNELIDRRINELLRQFPVIHEINDGFIVRFFTEWDNCEENADIRYKRIPSEDNPNEIIYIYFLPKNTVVEMKKREYINCLTCLSGALELNVGDNLISLTSYNKICLEQNEFQGKALEDTYVISTNMK